MEIVSKFDSLLSNAEVLDIIEQNLAILDSDGTSGRSDEVFEMEDRVKEYIWGTPSRNVRVEHIESLFRKLREFASEGFKPTELMNIANLRPTTLVELYAILDHAETRFGDERLENILSIIAEQLPASNMQEVIEGDNADIVDPE